MRAISVGCLLVIAALAGGACGDGGGGGPIQPPPNGGPEPVATVEATAPAGVIVAGQTKQIAVVVRDAEGVELIDRPVTFSSSSEAVATVSATGLVTAIGAGRATVTATSEGKSDGVTIDVREGALIGAAGGTLTALGGAVELVVPAGALAAETAITFEAGGALPTDPSQVTGSRVVIGPATVEFSVPAELRIPYVPGNGPSGVAETAFRLHRVQGSNLVSLGGAVDAGADEVSAEIDRLGAFAVARAPASEPCTDPEYRQFDFWVGEWNVTSPGGLPVPSDITLEPGGCAMFENFANGNGRSINVFSPVDGMWHQTFYFSNGQRMVLIGELVGEEMIMESPNPPGPPGSFNRWTWTPLPDGRVRQLQEQSVDGGLTVGGFDGTYAPR
ncbi:MAG TPA: Ig-like domain-containing protein [Gemmatimonadota bacterium]|nr:Ig-like domain-containing protein [Gemmatimonadota bacterium]